MSCLTAVRLSSSVEKNKFSQQFRHLQVHKKSDAGDSGQMLFKLKNGEARHGGTQFNTATGRVKKEKRPTVSLYLDELLG